MSKTDNSYGIGSALTTQNYEAIDGVDKETYDRLVSERDKLKAARQKVMPYLTLSTDIHAVNAVYHTPAYSLRLAAEAMEAKDKAIQEAREALGIVSKGVIVNGNGNISGAM